VIFAGAAAEAQAVGRQPIALSLNEMPSKWYTTSKISLGPYGSGQDLLFSTRYFVMRQGIAMGWQSDWLYRLIFDEAAKLWAQAQKEGSGTFGPAPERFYIQQCAAIAWEQLFCRPPILRVWSFDTTAPPALVTTLPFAAPDRTVRGMFYVDGSIQFCIADDRRRVAWNHVLGPRYGRGKVFRVRGQGKTATLEQDSAFGEWVS
jgi:hypothetical protein